MRVWHLAKRAEPRKSLGASETTETRSMKGGGSMGAETAVPIRFGETCQVRAKARRLEHSSTRLAVVSARNPPETASWLRMKHLPLSMLVRTD